MAAKINMRLDKNEMPSQDPNVRNKNFLEVALGYTEEQALDEAARCLNCKNHPCVDGCPVNVRIPEFIQKIVEKDYEGAYQVIHQTSSLPAVCGRVCPQESQCEMHCVRGKKGDPVGIGRLERFVADWHNAHSTEAAAVPAPNGHKVAVIGSGPAGLTCAGDLAKKGYEVTVFEALHLAGGVLDVHLMTMFYQLGDARRSHAHTVLIVFDLFRNTNFHNSRSLKVNYIVDKKFVTPCSPRFVSHALK